MKREEREKRGRELLGGGGGENKVSSEKCALNQVHDERIDETNYTALYPGAYF